MIGKVVFGSSFIGCLNYVTSKDGARLIGSNMEASSVPELASEFNNVAIRSTRIKKPVFHLSLSPHPEDKLSDREYLEFSKKLFNRLGMEKCQFYLVEHNDTETPDGSSRPHLHAVLNRIPIDDHKAVNSSFIKRRVEMNLMELQEEYGLKKTQASWLSEKAAPSTGQMRRYRREQLEYESGKRSIPPEEPALVKFQNIIDSAASFSTTMPELIKKVKEEGLNIRIALNKDKVIKGISFSDGEYHFRGSQLGRGYSFPGLQKFKNINYDPDTDNQEILQLASTTLIEKDDSQKILNDKINIKSQINNNNISEINQMSLLINEEKEAKPTENLYKSEENHQGNENNDKNLSIESQGNNVTPQNSKEFPETTVTSGGISVPILEIGAGGDEENKYATSPLILRGTILESMFSPDELKSLVVVKPNENKLDNQLDNISFPDGVKRDIAFSSGNSIYFANDELKEKIQDFFTTQKDHSCRYGSLLSSSCLEGTTSIDSSKGDSPLRIKIVDSESTNPEEKKEAEKYQTGDCHGKISPRLANEVGGKSNRPFQFRLAWKKEWGENSNDNSPNTSFLAKGTFLPDKKLTEDNGYDIILDRSSIKGVKKEQLAELIPCGDYSIPKAILGNRGNALNQNYANSWQLSVWYSKNAIEQDLAPETKKEAEKLAALQNDPMKLAQYLVEQHDHKKELGQETVDENSSDNEDSLDENKKSSKMIEILRNDKYGQLLEHPKVVDFMQNQLQQRWKDLAIKGAVEHGSAMAQPCNDLKPGTIVAPHLKQGEEVVVTRYPIVSKDNIRRYTVDNEQKPELQKYKGCAFIRPDEAMKNHQCDFDGDVLVITSASRIPNIAKETIHANDVGEFKPVEKRKKIDYTEALDKEGNKKYNSLGEIALAIPQNKIGVVATATGRVQSSEPRAGDSPEEFLKKQEKLLNKLFDALQIEVDGPKSATRLEDHYPKLMKEVKAWKKNYPNPMFDFKENEDLYVKGKLPINSENSTTVLAEKAVNPAWESSKLDVREASNFRYLMKPPESESEKKEWEQKYVPWATETKNRINTIGKKILDENIDEYGKDTKTIKEEFGKLYSRERDKIEELFPSKKEKELAASALWHVETTKSNSDEHRKKSEQLSTKLNATFKLVENYQRENSLIREDTWVMSVPFKKIDKDESGKKVLFDYSGSMKDYLDKKGIEYQATVDKKLPMVNFALVSPSKGLVKGLDEKFSKRDTPNHNEHLSPNDLKYQNKKGEIVDLRVETPQDLTWAKSQKNFKKAGYTLNLFAEEICSNLSKEIEKTEVVGQKYNDYKDVDFQSDDWKDKKVELSVGVNESPGRYYGQKILLLSGKNLGMFNKETPQLPIGTSFEATINKPTGKNILELNIIPESIKIKDEDLEKTDNISMDSNKNQTKDNQVENSNLDKNSPQNTSATLQVKVEDKPLTVNADSDRNQTKNNQVESSNLGKNSPENTPDTLQVKAEDKPSTVTVDNNKNQTKDKQVESSNLGKTNQNNSSDTLEVKVEDKPLTASVNNNKNQPKNSQVESSNLDKSSPENTSGTLEVKVKDKPLTVTTDSDKNQTKNNQVETDNLDKNSPQNTPSTLEVKVEDKAVNVTTDSDKNQTKNNQVETDNLDKNSPQNTPSTLEVKVEDKAVNVTADSDRNQPKNNQVETDNLDKKNKIELKEIERNGRKYLTVKNINLKLNTKDNTEEKENKSSVKFEKTIIKGKEVIKLKTNFKLKGINQQKTNKKVKKQIEL